MLQYMFTVAPKCMLTLQPHRLGLHSNTAQALLRSNFTDWAIFTMTSNPLMSRWFLMDVTFSKHSLWAQNLVLMASYSRKESDWRVKLSTTVSLVLTSCCLGTEWPEIHTTTISEQLSTITTINHRHFYPFQHYTLLFLFEVLMKCVFVHLSSLLMEWLSDIFKCGWSVQIHYKWSSKSGSIWINWIHHLNTLFYTNKTNFIYLIR